MMVGLPPCIVYPRAYDARAGCQHLCEERGPGQCGYRCVDWEGLVGEWLGVTKGLDGFDGFSDLNSFAMKTLNAYVYFLFPS